MIITNIIIIALLCFVMGKAAQSITSSVRVIALSLGFSQFLVAFVLLGLATSTPEISVAVFAAIEKTPGLSLGNLLGANIVILSLLCGAAAIAAGKMRPADFNKNRLLPLFLLEILLPVYVILDGRLTRADGVFLLLAHAAFLLHVYRRHRATFVQPEHREFGLKKQFWKSVAVAALATGVLLVSSYLLVETALSTAQALGVAPLLIGLLMFSLGTNMPEVTFTLTQSRKNDEIVLGDLFGSVLVNTPTLGLLALISPFALSAEQAPAVYASSAFLVVLAGLFGWCMWTDKALERREGYWLVLFYVVFVAYHVLTAAASHA